jgi:hypothetical protein
MSTHELLTDYDQSVKTNSGESPDLSSGTGIGPDLSKNTNNTGSITGSLMPSNANKTTPNAIPEMTLEQAEKVLGVTWKEHLRRKGIVFHMYGAHYCIRRRYPDPKVPLDDFDDWREDPEGLIPEWEETFRYWRGRNEEFAATAFCIAHAVRTFPRNGGKGGWMMRESFHRMAEAFTPWVAKLMFFFWYQ